VRFEPVAVVVLGEGAQEGESAFGREFWSVFLDQSPITFIECVK